MGLVELLVAVVFAVSVAVGLALAPTATTPGEFLVARIGFIIAAVSIVWAFFHWLHEGERAVLPRTILGLLLGILVFVILPEALGWISGKEHPKSQVAGARLDAPLDPISSKGPIVPPAQETPPVSPGASSSSSPIHDNSGAAAEKSPRAGEKAMSNKKSDVPGSGNTIVNVGPGGVASFGQQGGQTAGTIINHGPPPMIITPPQEARFAASVKPFLNQFEGKRINISMHQATGETAAFGNGLSRAFELAGFQTNTGIVTFIGAALDRGITIRFGQNREDIAIAVMQAIQREGLYQKVYHAKGLDPDDFLLIIAP